jgi:serine phosphatase RsbU (regulator of sigma subunit)
MGNTGIHAIRQRARIIHPVASMMAAELAATRSELAEVHRELFEAAQMQRRMSGPRQLRRGEFEIAAEMFPIHHLSGDFFSIIDAGETTLFAIGDIAGKGLRAGMWFTHLLGLARMYSESIADPGDALAAINRQMCRVDSPPPLTSLFLAQLHWMTGEVVYSNAGHPAALLLGGDGSLERLATGGPLLGAVPGARFESAAVHLMAGDTLLAFTDGLLECCDQSMEEFGEQRVVDTVRGTRTEASVSELLFSVVGAAQDFAGSQPRADDCTLIALCRSPAWSSTTCALTAPD